MQLSPSDIFTLYRPSVCDLRVYLRHHGFEEDEPGPYDELLRTLGERHEAAYLETLGSFVDMRAGSPRVRERETIEAVNAKTGVIYQPALRSQARFDDVNCDVVGSPDFLIYSETHRGYLLRDCKMARQVVQEDHPELFLQMTTYGWLFEQTFGRPPQALQVVSGTGGVVDIPYDGGASVRDVLQRIVRLKQAPEEPYSPVGWSKCGSCPFRSRCWGGAKRRRDVALVMGVDQGLAIALRHERITTPGQLLKNFSIDRLTHFERPRGPGTARVGRKAGAILTMARAFVEGKPIVLQKPPVPESDNYVVFDLEGLPPQLDELEKIYLWGLQVFGSKPSRYMPATADFGPDGDRHGWLIFLGLAEEILCDYDDIPFIHWAPYERTKLDLYIDRFGDPDGIAARVRTNLHDLYATTQRSIALPLPSYSLKEVEKYIGFKRTQDEYGGEWSMAKYIEATETEDEELRNQVMAEILKYNEEDLQATWAVVEWLKKVSRERLD